MLLCASSVKDHRWCSKVAGTKKRHWCSYQITHILGKQTQGKEKQKKNVVNPLHPNISMHILHTVLYTFQRGWQGEIVQQSRAALVGDHLLYSHNFHFLYSCDLNVWFKDDIVRRN